MNKNMSLNNGLECNILIKADDISTDTINKIRTKNKKMNISEENSKLFNKKNKINKNFLRKKFGENNNYKNEPKKECLPDEFFKNHVFQYYYSTIKYLKKHYNDYMNSNYSKSISINYNVLNINNYYIYDQNINNASYIKTSNINKNLKMKNNFLINYQDKKINFIFKNNKNVNERNKTSGFYNNLANEHNTKINAFSKEVISNNNLNPNFEPKNKTNNNEFLNLIKNINYPSFEPSNFNNQENKDIISESNIILTKVEKNKKGKENVLTEEEYSVKMFGKKGWICVLCNNFNFETRVKCNRCKELKNPKKIIKPKCELNNENNLNNDNENSDWVCSKCLNFNYSFRTICNRCKAPKITQFLDKPFLHQNLIYNNIMSYSPILSPSFVILNNIPYFYLNKFV